MNLRVIVAAAAVVVVAVIGFLIAPSSEPDKAPTVAEAPPAPAEPAAPAPAEPAAAPFKYDHFRVGNRNIKAMLSDGSTMWVGTSGGVIRYDVTKDDYSLYDNRNALLSNGVFHLSKVNGEIWVGTYGGGLSVFNPETDKWRNYNVPNGMGDAFIYDALVTKSGDIWLATWSGANLIKGDMDDIRNWSLFTLENTKGGLPNDWVYGLAEGKNGDVWIATEGGLALYRDGKWKNWDHRTGLGADYDDVKDEIEFKSDPGSASSHHAIQKQEQGLEDVSIAYNPNYIISLEVDDDGNVWAGTWGAGLSFFDGENWKNYTTKDGLPSNHIFMVKKGPDGTIYVGTSGGLAKKTESGFVNYAHTDGLFSDNVFSVAFGADGTTWVGSFGGVARFYDGLPAKAHKE